MGKVRGCPDRETWCGYLDGTITGRRREELKEHLKACRSCFEEVASIRSALIESSRTELVRTPDVLLKRGKELHTEPTVRPTRWRTILYAAAACVVLGLVLQAYKVFVGSMPLPSAVRIYTALRHSLEADGRSVPPDLLKGVAAFQAPHALGFSPVDSYERNIFRIGVLMAELYMDSELSDAEHYLKLLDLMHRELAKLGAPTSLIRFLDTLRSVVTDGRSGEKISPMLDDLGSDLEDFARKKGKDLKVYLKAGEWVGAMAVAARIVVETGGTTPENRKLFRCSKDIEYLLEFFRDRGAPIGVIRSLERMLEISKKEALRDEDLEVFLAMAENLRRLLS